MTYSIVARDPDTGELGVAVQSHYFSVGGIVPWAEAGVGAVATQSIALASYGFRGIGLMRRGIGARAALDELVAEDAGSDTRQVAFVDAMGGTATHTGARCIAEAGDEAGPGFSVQANMMARSTVWAAMAAAFQDAQGDLAHRLLASLDAAESEGGDLRGRQSAALLVVRAETTGDPCADRRFDLRVEDHSDPLGELRRLVDLRRAYALADRGDEAMGSGDVAAAVESYSEAGRLYPTSIELPFWRAVTLAGAGHLDEAALAFEQVFSADLRWRDLLHRVVAAGLVEIDPAFLARVTAAT